MPNFRVLPGLMATGPRHIPFPAKGKAEYSECFVVQFSSDPHTQWVGNFAPGWNGGATGAYDCYGSQFVLVVSSGDVWLVEAEKPGCATRIENWTKAVVEIPEHQVLLLVNPISFVGVGAQGLVWRSKRVSWDGFRDLVVEGKFLTGQSWTPIDQKWVPFRLNVLTGEHEGGAYTLGDM